MSPQLPYSVTIPPNIVILLHGFNSAPGNKAKEIEEFLSEKKIKDKYKHIKSKLMNQSKQEGILTK